MLNIVAQDIPYCSDSSLLFESWANDHWAIFLDSAKPAGQQGRYDLICAQPKITLVTRGHETTVTQGDVVRVVPDDPFQLLQHYMPPIQKQLGDWIFCGGAMGYFGYDLGRRIERLPTIAENDLDLPDMAVGIYTWSLIVDHQTQTSTLVGDLNDARTRLHWDDLIARFSRPSQPAEPAAYKAVTPIQSNMSETAYEHAFSRVKDYIKSGDCYQVNLAQRFQAKVSGQAWSGYRRLRRSNPSPYSAFMNLPGLQILSASPERFLYVCGEYVETKPIKGTRPRREDPDEDAVQRQELVASEKDHAENLMIVDLLRNDLSRVCTLGSVKVPKLFSVESFPTVHHLVSTVTGRLGEFDSPLTLLRACFPGGSITGAPKIRAMEIIEELEPQRRGVYCGSIGYISVNGRMDTSIAIRTMVQKDDQVYFHAGGGLVWDSECKSEYQETFDKAAAMIKLLAGP